MNTAKALAVGRNLNRSSQGLRPTMLGTPTTNALIPAARRAGNDPTEVD